MYRRLMWCYVFVLTLLDLSLNSKLTAQGKSHGVTVHDSLVEGITFQEWGSEAGGGLGSGRALPAGALRAEPAALAFGRAPLGAAHAATVTLTNTANTTMHLASIAGTTPDFHASFFDSKTLACGANTSFSVVYLGRREGPVAQHLYLHTSLGVLKYPVSAVGVASEWELWPLVGVQVPQNATLRPLLTMHNPTDHTVQVVEMYSSAAWLGLQLPGGGAAAPRAHWQLPPRSSRALARLRLRAPPQARAAYIRIKANVTGPPLVVVVEAGGGPAGAHADPLQLRAGTRGAADAPYTFTISLGNSADTMVGVSGGAWGACRRAPHAPPPAAPPRLANGAPHSHADAGADGVQLSLLRTHLEPHQEPEPAAQVTFDFSKLWAGGTEDSSETSDMDKSTGTGTDTDTDTGTERWCAGWAALPGGALPYSVRLLPGTLWLPPHLHFVTADEEGVARAQEVRARNEFARPVRVLAVHFSPGLEEHFHTETWPGVELAPGAERLVARLRLKKRDVNASYDGSLYVDTDLTRTRYAAPVRLYRGTPDVEWEWPNATAAELPLGTLGTSSTRRVLARVRNPAPVPLCATAHSALPGATLELHAPGGCIAAGGWSSAVLTVVAPARAGAVTGAVWLTVAVSGAAGTGVTSATAVTLRALPGAVRARLLHHEPERDHHAAPWASGWAPSLVVESTMAARMRVTRVEPQPPDPALVFVPPEDPDALWISPGTQTIGVVRYLPERACGAACYTGAHAHAHDWLRASLHEELELLAERRALYRAEMLRALRNVSLAVDTTEMVRIPVSGWVRMGWPRLALDSGWLGLAGVGAGAGGARWLRVRNPAPHPLLLRALLSDTGAAPDTLIELPECAHNSCVADASVFSVAEWRAVRGGVTSLRGEGQGQGEGEALVLAPHAELELRVQLQPPQPSKYTATLYLRNNLTIIEALQIGGQGAVPSFELAGRRAHKHKPILLQVEECSAGSCAAEWRREARRTLVARNTGAVPLRLRGWRLAGEPCRARGFALEPCGPLTLAPNESRALTLAFRADCSLARVPCPLTLRADSGPATFRLLGGVPARLLPACAASLPRPPWEPLLRTIGILCSVVTLAVILAAAALDAERLLRRARDARAAPVPRAPLDLRALAREAPPAPPPAAAPRRKRPARRARPAPDPDAERRAFERWRADVLRRDAPPEDESSRSSEEAEPPPPPAPEPDPDPSDTEPDTEGAARDSGSSSPASGSSSPAEDSPPSDSPRPAPADSPGAPPPPARAPCAAPPPESRGGGAAVRARRSPGEAGRRAEPAARARPALGKHHARKDKVSRRRSSGGSGATRLSPAGARAAPAAPQPALRWGASWSSVVACGPAPPAPAPAACPAAATPPAPAPAPRADHSLFYFNDAHAQPPPEPEYKWRAPDPDPFDPVPVDDYRVPDEPAANHSNAYGTIGSPWSGAGLWGALRPPPGFGPRAPLAPPVPHVTHTPHTPHVAHAPHVTHTPVRAFDPFHSLASIWAPAAFDWRAEPREREPREPH